MRRCFFAPHSTAPCMYRPDGLPDRAHLIPKQRLRIAGIDDVWDNRAWVLSCRRHHHLFDQGYLPLSIADYPPEFIDFATEHGLHFVSERRGWRVGYREAA